MRRFVLALLILFLVVMIASQHQETLKLVKEITQLRELKAHFYDFRGKVMSTIPMDYLSELTIDDFDFDKYEEQ